MDPAEVEKNLHVGQLAFMQVEPRDQSRHGARCYIRGWQLKSYILLDVPDQKAINLRHFSVCNIRYVTDNGCACRFSAEITDLGTGASFDFVRITWPKVMATMPIRRHQRIDLTCSCTVFSDEASSIPSQLIDLSRGGCRLKTSQSFGPDTTLHLSFRLPDGSVIDGIPAVVLNASKSGGGYALRCAFKDPDESHLYDIEFYIASTLARLRSGADDTPRLLLVEPDEKEADRLWVLLRDCGYDVFITHNLVDAFFQLRNHPPTGVVMNAVLPVVSGSEACQSLRDMRQFKDLPIVLYGARSEALRKEAEDAGATKYISDTTKTHEFMQAFPQG